MLSLVGRGARKAKQAMVLQGGGGTLTSVQHGGEVKIVRQIKGLGTLLVEGGGAGPEVAHRISQMRAELRPIQ
eukprot:4312849-Pyramimonas_sp.AAC.1